MFRRRCIAFLLGSYEPWAFFFCWPETQVIFGVLLGGFRFSCSQYCLKDPQALQLLLHRIELTISLWVMLLFANCWRGDIFERFLGALSCPIVFPDQWGTMAVETNDDGFFPLPSGAVGCQMGPFIGQGDCSEVTREWQRSTAAIKNASDGPVGCFVRTSPLRPHTNWGYVAKNVSRQDMNKMCAQSFVSCVFWIHFRFAALCELCKYFLGVSLYILYL
jgi:hypothetical protein